MLKFWSDFGFTVMLSYFFYLIIEAPLGGFDSLLKPKKKSTEQTRIAYSKTSPAETQPEKNPDQILVAIRKSD